MIFVWYKKSLQNLSSVLSQSTHLTDRRMDTSAATRPPCIQCSAVKISGGKNNTVELNLGVPHHSNKNLWIFINAGYHCHCHQRKITDMYLH